MKVIIADSNPPESIPVLVRVFSGVKKIRAERSIV